MTVSGFAVGSVYALTNVLTGKQYVGQTVQVPERRMKAHLVESRNGSTRYISNAIRRYGIGNFKLEVLHRCTLPLLDAAEAHFIGALRTLRPHGYNLTTGGQTSPKKLSAHTRRKISESTKRRYMDPAERDKSKKAMHAWSDTPEGFAARSAGQKRRFADPAKREVNRLAQQKRWASFTGISEETRALQSRVQKARAAARTEAERAAHRERCRLAQLKRYAREEERQKTGERSKAAWTEERKRANGAALRARWNDPAFKAKMLQKFAARWARVRAAGGLNQEELVKRSEAQKARYRREREA